MSGGLRIERRMLAVAHGLTRDAYRAGPKNPFGSVKATLGRVKERRKTLQKTLKRSVFSALFDRLDRLVARFRGRKAMKK